MVLKIMSRKYGSTSYLMSMLLRGDSKEIVIGDWLHTFL
jgi:hypothetical protein